MTNEWTSEEDEELDRILGQATGLLAQRGDEQAVALLVDVRFMTLADTSEVVRTEKVWDAWTEDDTPATRTIYRREALLDVDEHLLPRFTEEGSASGSLRQSATSLSATASRTLLTQDHGQHSPKSTKTGGPHTPTDCPANALATKPAESLVSPTNPSRTD